MKIYFAYLLSLVLLLNGCSQLVIYLQFKAQQTEIAKTLCELRAQELNSCNGHCVLENALKKAAEKEKKESQLLKEKQELVFVPVHLMVEISSVIHIELLQKASILKPNSWTYSPLFSIFHPPSLKLIF